MHLVDSNLRIVPRESKQFGSCRPLYSSYNDRDHEFRSAWIGPSFPLDLSTLPLKSEDIPLQYHSLSKSYLKDLSIWTLILVTELGYSSTTPDFTLDERRKMGEKIEQILKGEKEAARAPE